MKLTGYEVTGTRPVCVDFADGRVVSFRPGMRFTAVPVNRSVLRLLRTREIRKLTQYEQVPALPPKLGAPHRVQNVLKARAEVEAARRLATAKLAASKAAAPKIEVAKPKPKPPQPKKPASVAPSKPASDPKN